MNLDAKHNYFGYLNRWGRLVVENYDVEKEIEAMNSPSVFKVFRFIEASNMDEAISIAGRRLQQGEGFVTHAGHQEGIK